jgi:hypothetical protein
MDQNERTNVEIRTHQHSYYQHPGEGWGSHVACSQCGFAINRLALRQFPELIYFGPVMPTDVFNARHMDRLVAAAYARAAEEDRRPVHPDNLATREQVAAWFGCPVEKVCRTRSGAWTMR